MNRRERTEEDGQEKKEGIMLTSYPIAREQGFRQTGIMLER